MSICSISDVHIKEVGDPAHELLMSFLKHPKVRSAEVVVLLGDIFDLMVGGFSEYEQQFPDIFKQIVHLAKEGKRIIYLEGNHDFHLKNLIAHLKNTHNLPETSIELHSAEYVVNFKNGKRVFLSHGDEFDTNPSYIRYKKFIRGRFIELLLEGLVSHSFVRAVGQRASKKSRKRNIKKYENAQGQITVRDNFRSWLTEFAKENPYDLLVCGHSHYEDSYALSENSYYMNNGYFPVSKKFIFIDQEGQEFIELS
jgi:UDP-2,3-diacylglucosamine hydrolase